MTDAAAAIAATLPALYAASRMKGDTGVKGADVVVKILAFAITWFLIFGFLAPHT